MVEQQASSETGAASAATRRAGQMATLHIGMMQTAADTARRSARAGAKAMTGGIHAGAEQAQDLTRGMMEATAVYGKGLQTSAQRIEALMACSRGMTEGLPRTQQAAMTWFSRSVQANARFAQDLLRCRSLGDIAQIHIRFVDETMRSLIEGGAEVLRSTEEMLRDVVEEIEGGAEQHGTAADVMTTDVRSVAPNDAVQEAARIMGQEDAGALPVVEKDKVVGMVTDRDLAVRVVAAGADPAAVTVREVMAPEVTTVHEDEDLDRVAELMAAQQVRRIPVTDHDEKLVGIISLGDIATEGAPEIGQQVLSGTSQDGGIHQQDLSQTAGHKPRQRRAQGRKATRR